jgi:hypothetical protein
MYLLSKILPLFVLPFGVSLILIVWGLLRNKRWPIWCSLLLLLLTGNPLLSNQLVRLIEAGQVRRPASEAPQARAIVVLSGARPTAPGPAHISEWSEADRQAWRDLFAPAADPDLHWGRDAVRAERAHRRRDSRRGRGVVGHSTRGHRRDRPRVQHG